MLNFFFKQQVPLILQTEAAECGLACLAMVANYYGYRVDLASLRTRHSISLKGTTLADLIRISTALKLTVRPLRLDLQNLHQLKLPCIVHWDFNHFVLLTEVGRSEVVILDPAVGRRKMLLSEFSKHFTGIALELSPNHDFVPKKEKQQIRLKNLLGHLPNLGGMLTQVIVLAIVLQIFAVLSPFYLQWIVDQALVSQDTNLIKVLGLGFLLLLLLQVGISALRGYVLMVLGTTLNLQLLSNLFRHLIKLPMMWFDKRHMGDILSRFESLNAIQRTISVSFLETLIDGLMAVITLMMMFIYSAKLAFVGLIGASLYAVTRAISYGKIRLTTEEYISRTARQQSHFLESVRGIQSIKLSNREQQRTTAWENILVDQFNANLRTQRLNLICQSFNGLIFGIENVFTIWLGALLVLDVNKGSAFSIGMLFAFIAYKIQFVQRISNLIDKGLEFNMLKLHTDRVADIALSSAESFDEILNTKSIEGKIELKNVSFRYAETDVMILDNINIRISKGESVAIIGPSGCGKTTLLKLMLGLLQPSGGCIEIDGLALQQIGNYQYRNAVASVMQDDQLFAGSIAENICGFDQQPNHDLIEKSSKLAAIHEDIIKMPMQYNTLVGDMGTVLSGGQKQRILLARALYRQPKILFLDEATSHLDVAAERIVNESMRMLDITRIIIAHRPETILAADRIIDICHGEISKQVSNVELRSVPA